MRMQRHFGREGVYPAPSDGDPDEVAPQLFTRILLERWRARRDEIRIVTGHFPLCTAELLNADFSFLTVLRDPVERTLSYLRHHRVTTPKDRDTPLEKLYEDPPRFKMFIENQMVKMLSLDAGEMTNGLMTPVDFDRGRLRKAKRALKGLDMFGLQEDLEGFAQELERRTAGTSVPPSTSRHAAHPRA